MSNNYLHFKGENNMALSFIKNGVTDDARRKRPTVTKNIEWHELPTYFLDKLRSDHKKLIRHTMYAKRLDKSKPIEARMMFANSNVPLGELNGKLVKAVVCKSKEEGVAIINEYIKAVQSDSSTQKVLAKWFMKHSNLKFDTDSIPKELKVENS